jgi:hypothetical protein
MLAWDEAASAQTEVTSGQFQAKTAFPLGCRALSASGGGGADGAQPTALWPAVAQKQANS